MTFWQSLVAASSLTVGSVWDLITHPRSGGSGVVVNDGIAVEVAEMVVEATVEDTAIEASVDLNPVEAQVEDNPIIAEVEEW